jgi:hypothetical protein
MRRKLMLTVAAVAGALAPLIAGAGGAPSHAMTCAAEPPIDTACDVVFGVLGLVCNGTVPKPPTGPVALNTATRPDLCPPLG